MLEDLELMHHREFLVLIVRGLRDEFGLHIKERFAGVAVGADEVVKGVAAGYPADETDGRRQRHDIVALNL